MRYAARALGWAAKIVANLDCMDLAAFLGLNRKDDFLGVEAEEPGLLIAVNPFPEKKHLESSHWITAIARSAASKWTGRANLLDLHPVYRWPIIDIVAEATRGQPSSEHLDPDSYLRSATTVKQRRQKSS